MKKIKFLLVLSISIFLITLRFSSIHAFGKLEEIIRDKTLEIESTIKIDTLTTYTEAELKAGFLKELSKMSGKEIEEVIFKEEPTKGTISDLKIDLKIKSGLAELFKKYLTPYNQSDPMRTISIGNETKRIPEGYTKERVEELLKGWLSELVIGLIEYEKEVTKYLEDSLLSKVRANILGIIPKEAPTDFKITSQFDPKRHHLFNYIFLKERETIREGQSNIKSATAYTKEEMIPYLKALIKSDKFEIGFPPIWITKSIEKVVPLTIYYLVDGEEEEKNQEREKRRQEREKNQEIEGKVELKEEMKEFLKALGKVDQKSITIQFKEDTEKEFSHNHLVGIIDLNGEKKEIKKIFEKYFFKKLRGSDLKGRELGKVEYKEKIVEFLKGVIEETQEAKLIIETSPIIDKVIKAILGEFPTESSTEALSGLLNYIYLKELDKVTLKGEEITKSKSNNKEEMKIYFKKLLDNLDKIQIFFSDNDQQLRLYFIYITEAKTSCKNESHYLLKEENECLTKEACEMKNSYLPYNEKEKKYCGPCPTEEGNYIIEEERCRLKAEVEQEKKEQEMARQEIQNGIGKLSRNTPLDRFMTEVPTLKEINVSDSTSDLKKITSWEDLKAYKLSDCKRMTTLSEGEIRAGEISLEISPRPNRILQDGLGFIAFELKAKSCLPSKENMKKVLPVYHKLNKDTKIYYENAFLEREDKMLELILEYFIKDKKTGEIQNTESSTDGTIEKALNQMVNEGLLKLGKHDDSNIYGGKKIKLKNVVMIAKVKLSKEELGARLNKRWKKMHTDMITETLYQLNNGYKYVLFMLQDLEPVKGKPKVKGLYPNIKEWLMPILEIPEELKSRASGLNYIETPATSELGYGIIYSEGSKGVSADLPYNLVTSDLLSGAILQTGLDNLEDGRLHVVSLDNNEHYQKPYDNTDYKHRGLLVGATVGATENNTRFIDDEDVKRYFSYISYGAQLIDQFEKAAFYADAAFTYTPDYAVGVGEDKEFHLMRLARSVVALNLDGLTIDSLRRWSFQNAGRSEKVKDSPFPNFTLEIKPIENENQIIGSILYCYIKS